MANEKILVVDDELPIRLALKTAFLREGMQVQEASCGKEALEALKGDHYDLVVLDVMMEDMDGYTILQKLRAADAQRKAGGDGSDPGSGNGGG